METLSIFQNHYPERLHHAYLLFPPWLFSGFWRVISPFIDSVTKAKVSFHSGSADPDGPIAKELRKVRRAPETGGGEASPAHVRHSLPSQGTLTRRPPRVSVQAIEPEQLFAEYGGSVEGYEYSASDYLTKTAPQQLLPPALRAKKQGASAATATGSQPTPVVAPPATGTHDAGGGASGSGAVDAPAATPEEL